MLYIILIIIGLIIVFSLWCILRCAKVADEITFKDEKK